METEETRPFEEDIVDDELVAFFDLLAQFDYEDKKQAQLPFADQILPKEG